jgi:indole-3-glycerol phosphate synthase
MADLLNELAKLAWSNVKSGYYNLDALTEDLTENKGKSLKKAIKYCNSTAIIAEIKFSSPSKGTIREKRDFVEIAKKMVKGGAIGLSILTEPRLFKGSLNGFIAVRKSINLPLLMKDLVVHEAQINCARKVNANAILLILQFFERGYTSKDLDYMINYAHSLGLEVLLETHTFEEFKKAVRSEADIIGINNRDLRSMKVSIEQTKAILEKVKEIPKDKVIVSESGIGKRKDIEFLMSYGVNAFLVGSSIMQAKDIEKKVRELVGKG